MGTPYVVKNKKICDLKTDTQNVKDVLLTNESSQFSCLTDHFVTHVLYTTTTAIHVFVTVHLLSVEHVLAMLDVLAVIHILTVVSCMSSPQYYYYYYYYFAPASTKLQA